nr:oxidoreductase [Paenibacillus periandrae]
MIGNELVAYLMKDPSYERVVVVVRRKLQIVHPKCIQVITNYEQLEDELKAYVADSDVFCCLGTTIKKARTKEQFRKVDLEYPMRLGKLAQTFHAAYFGIVTAMGANADSSIFYSQVKGQVEVGLERLQLAALHIFRPSLLLGHRADARTGERIGAVIFTAAAPLLLGGLQKYKPIHVKTVARAMLQSAIWGNKGVHKYSYKQIEELAAAYTYEAL